MFVDHAMKIVAAVAIFLVAVLICVLLNKALAKWPPEAKRQGAQGPLQSPIDRLAWLKDRLQQWKRAADSELDVSSAWGDEEKFELAGIEDFSF